MPVVTMQGLWLVSARQHQSLQCYTFFFFTSESILTTLHVFFTRQNPSFFLHVSSRCSSEPIVTTLHVFFHIRTHRFFLHVSTHCFFFHVSTHCCTPREHCTSRNSVRFPQGIHFLCQLLSPALLSSPVMSCHVLSCPVLSCPSSLPLLHTLALSSLSLSLSIYLSIYIYIYIYIYHSPPPLYLLVPSPYISSLITNTGKLLPWRRPDLRLSLRHYYGRHRRHQRGRLPTAMQVPTHPTRAHKCVQQTQQSLQKRRNNSRKLKKYHPLLLETVLFKASPSDTI